MVMADRPEVNTAPGPIAAVDAVVLVQQLAAAVVRVPFRAPLRGPSNVVANLGTSVTREAVRSFMGYASSLPVDEFRSIEQLLDNVCRVVMPPVVASFGVSARTATYGGVPGVLYLPRGGPPTGVILYLHGGGYIGTSPRMYAFFTSRLCRETQCAVFVADYRLAPEFPYPAGVEDAVAVLEDLLDRGVPGERLLVAGDSGGGGLANTLILELPTRCDRARPAGVLLFSPEVDLELDEPSVTENAARDILPWNIPTSAYLHGVDPREGVVSAVDADLTGFPPTFVAWGGDEMFRDAIRRYVERLDRGDVMRVAHEEPGMYHVFPIVVPWAQSSRRVHQAVGAFVHARFVNAPPFDPRVLDDQPRNARR